ncbi:hypothetical protein QUB68_18835 [Microcoleus sp. A006_D1]
MIATPACQRSPFATMQPNNCDSSESTPEPPRKRCEYCEELLS